MARRGKEARDEQSSEKAESRMVSTITPCFCDSSLVLDSTAHKSSDRRRRAAVSASEAREKSDKKKEETVA